MGDNLVLKTGLYISASRMLYSVCTVVIVPLQLLNNDLIVIFCSYKKNQPLFTQKRIWKPSRRQKLLPTHHLHPLSINLLRKYMLKLALKIELPYYYNK